MVMESFWMCFCYLTVVGVLSFLAGKALPREWFDCGRPLFRIREWERNGLIYERVGIRRWKDKVPDMSRIIRSMLPKRLSTGAPDENARLVLRETCVAEFIHIELILTGLGCLLIWPGAGGAVVFLLWVLGNVPFIWIQRYNRPRLTRLLGRMEAQKRRVPEPARNEFAVRAGFDLPCGRRA